MKTQYAAPISSGSARSESWIDPNFSAAKLQIPAEPGRESARALPVLFRRESGMGNRVSVNAYFMRLPILHSRFSILAFFTQVAARPPHAVEVRSS
jgi:hypothetical protein